MDQGSKKRWLGALGLFGAMVLSVNAYLVMVAKRTHSFPMGTDSPYERGQAFDLERKARERFIASGLQIDWSFWPEKLLITNQNGTRVSGLSLTLKAFKSNQASADFETQYMEPKDRGGVYLAQSVPDHFPQINSLWLIYLELRQGQEFMVEKRSHFYAPATSF